MTINAPDEIQSANSAKTPVYVNLFNGSEKSVVKLKVKDRGGWLEMKKVAEQDPYYVAMRQRETAADPKAGWNEPTNSGHLWKANLPADLKPGSHLLMIEGTDAYGRSHTGQRIIRAVK